MTVFRVNKNDNYTTMSNYHLKDKSISLKAKGLLSEMLSLPDDWNYSIQGLVAINKEEETSIKNTLNELKESGYLVITKLLPNETSSGRIEYIYDVYEKPKQEGEKQGVENLGVEFLGVENQGQLNTNILNTNNIKEIDNNKLLSTKKNFKKPTIDEIKQYCEERKNNVDAETFYDFYESKGWKIGKNVMKDWKASVRTWERNRNKQSNKKPSNRDYLDQLEEEWKKEGVI
jgi:hypothetical protein